MGDDADQLQRIISSWNGERLPLSSLLNAGYSQASLRSRADEIHSSFVNFRSKDWVGIHEQVQSLQNMGSGLLSVANKACNQSESMRPRAQHALHVLRIVLWLGMELTVWQALQSIIAVRLYLQAVVQIRDASRSFGENLRRFDAERDAPFSIESLELLFRDTALLVTLRGETTESLSEFSLAHSWAVSCLTSVVTRWRFHLEKACAQLLREIHWPCVQAGSELRLDNESLKSRVSSALNSLCNLQDSVEPGWLPQNCWLLPMLADPIVTRFKFHFGKEASATNRPDKPEWFLGFMARCISQHVPALGILIHSRSGISQAFIDRLLSPLRLKLVVLLKELVSQNNMALFSHCVKHVLSFDPSIADVLTKPAMRSVLLAVERDAANAHLQYILHSLPSPWVLLDRIPSGRVTTNSSDALLSTLYQMTNNTISKLPLLLHRLEFASLQSSLLAVYTRECETLLEVCLKDISAGGIRTSSTAAEDWSSYIGIINSLHCVRSVIEEWSDQLIFVELQFIRGNQDLPNRGSLTSADLLNIPSFETSIDDSFFSEECNRIDVIVGDFLDALVNVVLKAFQLAASLYINRSHTLHSIMQNPSGQMMISTSLCDALSTLSASLNLAAAHCSDQHLHTFWIDVAKGIDKIMFEGTIRGKYLTSAVVGQLHFDFNAILLLFRSFTDAPGAAMPMMTAAVALLTMPIDGVQRILSNAERCPAGLPPDIVMDICEKIIYSASVE